MPNRIDEVKSRPRDRVTIRLSGGRFFTIPDEQSVGLSIGDTLSEEAVERLDRMDQYFRGRDKAMTMISKRARTRSEVSRMLDGLEISASVRDGVIGELEELDLVNDERFAHDYVKLKTEVRQLGPHRLRHDLGKLGVRREYIDGALSELDADEQRSMAWAVVERKLGAGRVDERAVRRIAGLLQRKGFDFEVVNHVSYELLQRANNESSLEEH